jgi:SAM-dependent methyltransferase
MYLAQLAALADQDRLATARRVIDVGCENGLVTLFVASRCPEAEVIGLDVSRLAVDRAQELAQLLGIANATFVVTDFRNEHEIGAPADVVLCSRVLTAESRGDTIEGGFLISDELTLPESAPTVAGARAVGRLVRESGHLITTERLPGTEDAWEFVAVLAHGGFRPEWGACSWVSGHEVGSQQRWPTIVASRAAEPARVDDVLSYWAPPEEPLEEAAQSDDAAAELLFRKRAAGARVLAGIETEYFEGGTERFELRLARGRVYGWKSTTRGFRRLVVQPVEHLPEMLEEIREYAQEQEAWGLVTRYEEERPPEAPR